MLFGMDSQESSREIRRRIGYLPGDVVMYDRLTGHEFISYIANLRGGVDFGYVDLLAKRLESDLSRPIKNLSRGNVQKIGLIQAFMNRPELILMDEPSTGLDPLLQQEFYKMVNEVRSDGQTVFISSHILPEVERICDRVAIIRDGDLVAVEDVESLIGRAPRQMKIQFASPVGVEVFEGIAGVLQAELKEGVLKCTIQGSPDALIKKVSQYEIVNIVSEEPHLEDIFLSYYGEGGCDAE
jgi:ABC-2 type transport system ATP-binding protein